MCTAGANPVPKPAKVAPAPTAGSVATNPAANDNLEANRKTVAKRQGIFGNIRTGIFGDLAYGLSSLGGRIATFGRGNKAA